MPFGRLFSLVCALGSTSSGCRPSASERPSSASASPGASPRFVFRLISHPISSWCWSRTRGPIGREPLTEASLQANAPGAELLQFACTCVLGWDLWDLLTSARVSPDGGSWLTADAGNAVFKRTLVSSILARASNAFCTVEIGVTAFPQTWLTKPGATLRTDPTQASETCFCQILSSLQQSSSRFSKSGS